MALGALLGVHVVLVVCACVLVVLAPQKTAQADLELIHSAVV